MELSIRWLAARKKQEWVNEKWQVNDARNIERAILLKFVLGYAKKISEINARRWLLTVCSHKSPFRCHISSESPMTRAAIFIFMWV